MYIMRMSSRSPYVIDYTSFPRAVFRIGYLKHLIFSPILPQLVLRGRHAGHHSHVYLRARLEILCEPGMNVTERPLGGVCGDTALPTREEEEEGRGEHHAKTRGVMIFKYDVIASC